MEDDDSSSFEYEFSLSSDSSDAELSENTSDDGQISDEEHILNVDDPAELADFVNGAEAVPRFRRPAGRCWNIQRLPIVFNKKPMTSRVQHNRETYFVGALFGEEDLSEVKSLDFGKCDTFCPNCGARYWQAELSRNKNDAGLKCCTYGKFHLPNSSHFLKPTNEIINLYRGNSAASKNFQTNILKYNTLFATSFVSGDFQNVGSRQHGLWSLKVNGQVKWHNHAYQFDGDETKPPNHGQVYFMDFSDENKLQVLNNRKRGLQHNSELDDNIMLLLENYLRDKNIFVQAFKTTKEVEVQEREKAANENRAFEDVVLVINPKDPATRVVRVGDDYIERLLRSNQYTITPVADGIGAVFTGRLPPMSYDSMYFPRVQQPGERGPGPVFPSERTLDIQQFPLIHLHGEGSHIVLAAEGNRSTPSLAEYYRYRIAVRDDDFSIVHESKKLFAQYLLNGALRILYEWLSFRAQNQRTLKAESYSTLQRFVQERAAEQNRRVGRIVILPPGIYGSPRHMKDLFYDALAVSQKLGHPSWMITLTCNRNWPEIQEECARTGTDPNYRYDIVNRVFEMRANQLLSDIVRDQIFGRVLGEMTVREFQGRGLTHTHGLYIMRPEDTPNSAADIDKIIWAHFPDEQENPELFALVKKFMIHGPCDKNSPCQRNGKCKHGFPFSFRDETDISGKRPLYRRPDDGRGFYKRVRGILIFIDNRSIIPFSPVLLLRYVGHLNVMFSPSTAGCKYFYGYLLKGSYGNKVQVSMVKKNAQKSPEEPYVHDEIEEFKEMRHMGPYEAHYYIMGNSQAHIYPPVELLPVHEEFKQTIIHIEGSETAALERHLGTKLTAWFTLNLSRGPHRNKLYTDVVENYLFKDNVWSRSNRHTVGRMPPLTCTPLNSELYHVRLLLCNRTNITSFNDLRTVDNDLQPTFKAACALLNLIENEQEVFCYMDEVVSEQFPRALRISFALLLCNINPIDPHGLWEKYNQDLAADYLHDLVDDQELAYQLCLSDISEILMEFGKTLEDYNLPVINQAVLCRRIAVEEIGISIEEAYGLADALNVQQRQFFNAVIDSVCNKSDEKYFFLTGPGGTGKTFTYNVLIDYLTATGRCCVVAAYTGVAANLLKHGLTSHKAFGLPFLDEGLGLSRSTLKLQSKEANDLKKADVIIWDEISMVHAWHLHVVDTFLRDLMQNSIPFGGKCFIIGGDFRQILGVVPGGSQVDIVDAAVTSSNLWSLFKRFELSQNLRAAEDHDYASWLLTVGNGSANDPHSSDVNLPPDVIVKDINALIKHCFGDKIDKEDSHDAAILCPTNASASFVNGLVMDRVLKNRDDYRDYFSATSLEKRKDLNEDDEDFQLRYPAEYLDKLESASLPPHHLRLVSGTNIMLIRNLRVSGGLCNGTRLKVLKLYPNCIVCKIMTGSRKGETTCLFRITFVTEEFSLPGKLRRRQFPIRICYAITVNKSQGQTLIREGLYLRSPLWSHGQFYVAMSRVESKRSIKIFVEESLEQGRRNTAVASKHTTSFTRNVVYIEILRAAGYLP